MNIFIVTVIGIASFLIIFFIIFSNPLDNHIVPQITLEEKYEIEITGLKDTYVVGEPYSFSYILSGYGNSCGERKITFPISQNNTATLDFLPICTNSVFLPFKIEAEKNYGQTFGKIGLEQAGNYNVTAWFERGIDGSTKVSKSFTVIENNCDYPTYAENVECFARMYESCSISKINQLKYTMEEDPILYTAVIENQDNICSIKAIIDTSLDTFSSPTVTTHYCNQVNVSESGWTLSNCDSSAGFSFKFASQNMDVIKKIFNKLK